MIKKLLSIALIAVSVTANAQQFKVGQHKKSNLTAPARHANNGTQSVTVDTLMPASVASATGCGITGGLFNYVADATAPMDSGYIFGTGIINAGGGTSTNALECAQKYHVDSAGTAVTDVLVLAGAAHGTTATTVAKLYLESATTHKPTTQIGASSVPVAMAAYSTTAYTAFHFTAPIAVAQGTNFFAAVTVPAFGGADLDTLSILSTELGVCPAAGSDSCSAVKFATFGWYLTKVIFGANGDLMIFPVINITTTGVNDHISKGNLNLYAASPNPASNSVNINFSLTNNSKVDIEVLDVTGKVIKTVKGGEFAAGKGSVAVDVTTLDAGSYIYSITTNGAKMFSRFVVAK
ncbi:MAG: T9SS type A sorting domain-containing protein [Bacteroidia bacterium]